MSQRPTITELRLFVDGELPPEDAVRIERHLGGDPQARAFIDFERQLRARVAETFAAERPIAPTWLASRIHQSSAMARETEVPIAGRVGAADGSVDRDAVASPVIIEAAPPPVTPGQISRQRINVFAVAASLALVAGTVLLGLLGSPIDSSAQAHSAHLQQAATKVAMEHLNVRISPSIRRQALTFDSCAESNREFSKFLDMTIVIPELDDIGLDFVGGGLCEVPHCEHACHVVYQRTGSNELVSLHLVTGDGHFPEGTFISRDATGFHDVVAWSDGALGYLLTAETASVARTVAREIQRRLRID